jgi:hypothetical protein
MKRTFEPSTFLRYKAESARCCELPGHELPRLLRVSYTKSPGASSLVFTNLTWFWGVLHGKLTFLSIPILGLSSIEEYCRESPSAG